MSIVCSFKEGDNVELINSDREFPGKVLWVGYKYNRNFIGFNTAHVRVLVQSDRGDINVFSPKQLRLRR